MRFKPWLLLAWLGIASAAVCLVHSNGASKAQSAPGPVALTVMGKVADTQDDAELKAFEQFTASTGVHIRLAQSLQTVNKRIDLYLRLLESHSPEPDLLDLDVIWPATLAPHLVDLTPYFREELQAFSPELLRNFTVDGRLVALPTFVNAGLLYYRSDLLRKYGFHAPPATWDELDQMATVIQIGERRSGAPDFWGFVWQGGAFESLTCNALEWQASAGGDEILGPDHTVRVRNPQFLKALKRAVSWIGRISPPGEPAFSEDDSLNFWLAGKAAFMRTWTGPYGAILHSGSFVHNRTSVAALPRGEGGPRGTLGGSGTGISLYSAHPAEALRMLKVLVSESTQKQRAEMGGFVPSRIALQLQPKIMAFTPLRGDVAGQVVKNIVARPALYAGRSYSSVSRAYYTAVHSILTRQVSPEEGLAKLESDLVRITGYHPAPVVISDSGH